MTREMKRIMVTGAAGQIGSELTLALRKKFGNANVLATDIKAQIDPKLRDYGPYKHLDVLERAAITEAIVEFRADTVYHMSAILSVSGENKPQLAWNVNLNGTFNILEAAREECGWKPDYDLPRMTKDMLSVLRKRSQNGFLNS